MTSILLILAWISAPRLCAASAEGPPQPAGVASSSGQPGPFIPVSSTDALTAADVLARFDEFDRRLVSLSGRFKQTVSWSDAGIGQSTEGTIEYSRPDRLRLEHVKPERQVVVAHGDILWIHRLATNQVIETNLQDWKKADPLFSSVVDFGHYGRMLKSYDVSLSTFPPELLLRPKAKTGAADFSLRLKLADGDLFPREAELAVGEMRIKTAFENVRMNPDLPEKRFVFVPPPGADVLMNFKPPQASK